MGKLIGTLSDVLDRGRDAETLATADPMMLESARNPRRVMSGPYD
jgi:hypothetical protein